MRVGKHSWLPLAAVLGIAMVGRAGDPGPYRPAGFLEIPPQVRLESVSAVDCDSKGRIYVLHRGEPALLQFDKNGRFLKGWGEGMFKVAHGLRIDREDNVWTTDNALHVIHKFSPEGKLLLKLGEDGQPGSGQNQFRSPDDLVFSSTGEIYVADTGNGRIVRLRPDGAWIASWGKRGGKGRPHEPGEFAAAHGIAIDQRDRIYVADRGNHRVQVFDRDGKFLSEWKGFGNPFGALVVGEELLVSDGDAHTISHLSLRDGTLTKQWGDPEVLQLPHMMAVAPDQTLYVAEVSGKRIQRFRRQK
jgi:DNA-binding beta-propeller fold protein YncE